jgi:hypothetical protein
MLLRVLFLYFIFNATFCLGKYEMFIDRGTIYIISDSGYLLQCIREGCMNMAYLPRIINNSSCFSQWCTGGIPPKTRW